MYFMPKIYTPKMTTGGLFITNKIYLYCQRHVVKLYPVYFLLLIAIDTLRITHDKCTGEIKSHSSRHKYLRLLDFSELRTRYRSHSQYVDSGQMRHDAKGR